MNIHVVQAIGITGGLLLILGLFAPLMSTPIAVGMNLVSSEPDKIYAGVFAILAVVSWLVIVSGRFEGLFVTGLSSLILLGAEFWSFQQRLAAIRVGVMNALAGNPLTGITDISLNFVQIQWGWAVFGVGGLLLLMTPLLKNEALVLSKLVECPRCAEPIRENAIICRFCGVDLEALDEKIESEEHSDQEQVVE